MNYNAAITDFFKSPKWGTNLMLGAVSMIIPFVGPIVLQGWHVTGFWARGHDEDPTRFPTFDFQYFGKYLERGIWPFLVMLIASFALVPVILLVIGVPMLLLMPALSQSGNMGAPWLPIALFIGIGVVYMAFIFGFQFLTTPLILRATITQDFGKSFNLGFMKSFVALVWKEQLVAMFNMFGIAIAVMILTVITCYIGGLFAAPVAIYAWHHLQKQLYQLYLSRGGTAIPLSLKLADGPPALPVA